jgi:hypothetical protein
MREPRELSLEAMLADPIVRELMAADGVDADEVKALLRSVREAADRAPSPGVGRKADYFAFFARFFGETSRTRTAQSSEASRGADANLRESRTARADYSRLSTPRRGSMSRVTSGTGAQCAAGR